jgi:hypothetical protein
VSASGAVTLAEIAGKAAMLIIECLDCERFGRYRIPKLIEQHGADLAAVPAGPSRGGLSAAALGLDLPAMRGPDH